MRFFKISLLLCLIHVSSVAQWTKLSTGLPANFRDVCFMDAQTGFLAGEDSGKGVILKTTDGGATWVSQNFPGPVYSFSFPTVNAGYAMVGLSPQTNVYKTTDLGTSWNVISSVSTGPLSRMAFADENYGIVGSSSGFYLTTVNGGASWTSGHVGTATIIEDIFFTTDSIGYMAGWYGSLVSRTQDRGGSWTNYDPSGGDLSHYAVHFPSRNIGYTAGGDASSNKTGIYRTLDEGATWQNLPGASTYNGKLYAIHCPSDEYCIAAGDSGLVLETNDGGASWQKIPLATTFTLRRISCAGAACYLAGDSGAVYKRANPVGIPENKTKKNSLALLTDPVTGNTVLRLEGEMLPHAVRLVVYNLAGDEVHRSEGRTEVVLPESVTPKGFYIVKASEVLSGKAFLTQKVFIP
jgi:photosystem II stability/assembly factor-like uncharacterized protein